MFLSYWLLMITSIWPERPVLLTQTWTNITCGRHLAFGGTVRIWGKLCYPSSRGYPRSTLSSRKKKGSEARHFNTPLPGSRNYPVRYVWNLLVNWVIKWWERIRNILLINLPYVRFTPHQITPPTQNIKNNINSMQNPSITDAAKDESSELRSVQATKFRPPHGLGFNRTIF